MPAGQPNQRLADLMREAALSRKALARAVREMSVRRGSPVNCDHTSVSRWLGGMRPRSGTAGIVAELLSNALGRTVTLAEAGFEGNSRLDLQRGLTYGDRLEDSVTALRQLWQFDIENLPALLDTLPQVGAGSEAALRWLARPDAQAPKSTSIGRHIGEPDVETVRATTAIFDGLDNNFGGGHARSSLIFYLNSHVGPMLTGRYTGKVGLSLFGAAAESTLLAAWMSYDAGLHGLAQRYFIKALRLADSADDLPLGASILDAMSHQYNFLGHHQEAVSLARAARISIKHATTATLMAHFHLMEARASASAGDRVATESALNEATRIFERRKPQEDPLHMAYFDEAELHAEIAHCFHDIGRNAEAVVHADQALTPARSACARSDFFVLMVRAHALLDNGELEGSVNDLREALAVGRTVSSTRCTTYVRRYRTALAQRRLTNTATGLADEFLDHPIWRASDGQRGV